MFLMQSTLLVVYLTLPLLLPTLLYYCTIPKPLSSTTTSLPVENIHKKKIYKIENYLYGSGRYEMHFEWNPSGFVSFRFLFLFIFFTWKSHFQLQSKQQKTGKKTPGMHSLYLYLSVYTVSYHSLLFFPPF